MNRTVWLILLNLFGLALFVSYLCPPGQEYWQAADEAVFFFFNRRLVAGAWFLDLVAYANLRAFDLVAISIMGFLYLYYFMRADRRDKRRMIAVGLVMVFAAVAAKQISMLIPIEHPSPTRRYLEQGVNLISELTGIPAKDSAADTFPGDHGMMLMVFAAFMARYHGRRAFAAACLVVVVFSTPRIIGGAHWFSDIYMGSLAIVCIGMSWVLLTPLSDLLADLAERILPKKLYG